VAALGDAKGVVNVGAGAGSYEPRDRDVTAVEPSATMIAQRPPGAARAVQGSASALPFPDKHFDAAMALLTVHHWPDVRAGLKEMKRVARKRCVIFTWDVPDTAFWLTRDYFPEILAHDRRAFALSPFSEVFGSVETRIVPIPHDCSDGFLCAYWRRPEKYLDPGARAAISSFSYLGDVTARIARLAHDIEDGRWARRNAELLDKSEMDYGYRLVIAEL
jgi:SAM-dependent methyltransferase